MTLAVVFALAAAFSSAVNLMTQHAASIRFTALENAAASANTTARVTVTTPRQTHAHREGTRAVSRVMFCPIIWPCPVLPGVSARHVWFPIASAHRIGGLW